MEVLGLQGRSLRLAETVLRAALVIVVLEWGWATFSSDITNYFVRAEHTTWTNLPYRDYLWEYPPGAALPLALIPLTGHSNFGFHVVFITLMIVIEYACLEAIRRARPDSYREITIFWTLGVLPLAAIAYFRLDFMVMACAVVAMLAMVSGKRYVGATVAGFAVKLWPVVFMAPMLLQRRLRDVVVAVVGCLAVVAGWYAFSPEGFREFLDFRQGSGFQIESIPGSLLLLSGRESEFLFGALVVSDEGWEWVQTLMNVTLVLFPAVAFVLAWRRRSTVDLVAFTGFLVTVLLLSQRLLSPQFLVWLAPFIVWLWPAHRRVGYIFGVSTWITVFIVQVYSPFLRGHDVYDTLCVIRNALLLWLSFELGKIAFAAPATTSSWRRPLAWRPSQKA